MHSLMKRRY